ncbi:MAG: DUF4831 family protein [Bacteroidota bacterium]
MRTGISLSLSAIALLFFVSSCSTTQYNVVKVNKSASPQQKQGVFYALPRTAIRVDVTVSKTEDIKGPYSEFAGKLLGLTNVVTQNGTRYEISEVTLTSFASPDPAQYYFVEMNNAATKDFFLALDNAGMILGTDPSIQPDLSDAQLFSTSEQEIVYPEVFKNYSDLNLFEKVDTIIEQVKTDTVTIEKMTFKRSVVAKTIDQKARDAADFIIKIKENRFNLISGDQEVNYDKETVTYMDEQLDKLETEYRHLFTGLSFTNKIKYSYTIIPDATRPVDSVPLCRFSKMKGILEPTAAYGDLVFLNIATQRNNEVLASYVMAKDSVDKSKQHGFYYRIPEAADVSVIQGPRSMVTGTFLVSQFGIINCLPANLKKVSFYPGYGALRSTGGK